MQYISHDDLAVLRARGIAALRAGDLAQARDLLSQVVRAMPDDGVAWLWLSGAVGSDAERRYCLGQVLRVDPGNVAAQQGLAMLPAVPERSPLGDSPAAAAVPPAAPPELPAVLEVAPAAPEPAPAPSVAPSVASVPEPIKRGSRVFHWVVGAVLGLVVLFVVLVAAALALLLSQHSSKVQVVLPTVPTVVVSTEAISESNRLVLEGISLERRHDDIDAAFANYDKAIELNPMNADAYYYRGDLQAGVKHDINAGMDAYNRGKQIDANLAKLAYHLGRMYSRVDQYDKAIPYMTQAITADTSYGEAYYSRGMAYVSINDAQSAYDDFTKAIELSPTKAEAYYQRGLLFAIRDDATAIQDFNQALTIDPNYEHVLLSRGLSYSRLGDYQQARDDYTKSIALKPQQTEAYCQRSYVKYRLYDFEGSVQDATTALEYDPTWTCANFNRGLGYMGLNKWDLAITDFNVCIERWPNDGNAYYNRGNSYWYKGDTANAKADWERGLLLAKAQKNTSLVRQFEDKLSMLK